jgi:DnaJ-class molecular chaperone
MKDYYSILEINENATNDEIKIAFRRLMKIWHPDVCSRNNANERFTEIVDAYNILNEQHKREEYDENRKEMTIEQDEQAEEHPTTLFGCLLIILLIIISLSFVAYIAFKVYATLHGIQQ